MKKNLIILAITLAVLGAAFGYGVHKGTIWQVQKSEADRQALQDEILDLNLTLNERAAEILRLEAERKELVNDLENQAITAEGSDGPGIATTGGLQRLEQRWGSSSTSSK